MVEKLTEREWHFINEISLTIHSVSDPAQMRTEFLNLLQSLVKFRYASCYLFEDGKAVSPVGIDFTEEELNSYDRKLEKIDPFRPLRKLFFDQKHPAVRVNDYVFDEDIETQTYFREVWKPKNIRYSLFAGFGYQGEMLGCVSLYRTEDQEEFSDRDILIMNILKEHMNIRLFRDTQGAFSGKSIADLRGDFGLTDRELEVVQLWYRGLTDSEICREMAISNNTLKKHISNLFSKMNINSRVELLKRISK